MSLPLYTKHVKVKDSIFTLVEATNDLRGCVLATDLEIVASFIWLWAFGFIHKRNVRNTSLREILTHMQYISDRYSVSRVYTVVSHKDYLLIISKLSVDISTR